MAAKTEPKPEEGYKPMAAPKITDKDRIEALEARLKVLEEQVKRHVAYHFGKVE